MYVFDTLATCFILAFMQQGIGEMNNALAMLQNGNVAVQSGVVGVQNEDARVQRAVARAGKMWIFRFFGQKLIAEMGIWVLNDKPGLRRDANYGA